MHHFVIDGFRGYRSRLDDARLVQELLEEIPNKLGLQPASPPFLLPYYNGAVPEDCGISSFVFLAGGHFTIHTFSFREAFFADLLYPDSFDHDRLRALLHQGFPCDVTDARTLTRDRRHPDSVPFTSGEDFGPHLFMDVHDYAGPHHMDDLFPFLDRLPHQIDMTPIMRPYLIRSMDPAGQPMVSAMTMIAESHLSLHLFLEQKRAYFDLFSCRFFDVEPVVDLLAQSLPGSCVNNTLIARGQRYKLLRTVRGTEVAQSKAWLQAIPSTGADATSPGPDVDSKNQ